MVINYDHPLLNKNALLFDLDGTLLDSKDFLVNSSFEIVKKYFPGKYTREQFAKRFGDGFARIISDEEESRKQLALSEFIALKEKTYHRQAPLFPGVKQGLKTLHDRGVRLGIVTNQIKQASINALNEHEILHLFDIVIAIEDVPEGKPSPEGILRALQFMETGINAAGMVGDSRADLLAAHNAGVDSYLLTWDDPDVHAKQYNPSYICVNFAELLHVVFE